MHYDDQFPELNADGVYDESQPDGERVEPTTSPNFEAEEPKTQEDQFFESVEQSFNLKNNATVRGMFIVGKPKRWLLLYTILTAFSAFCFFIGLQVASVFGVILSAVAVSWFGLRFFDELRQYLHPTQGTLWSTATFPDGEVTVRNGETLTAKYTISTDEENTYYEKCRKANPWRFAYERWRLALSCRVRELIGIDRRAKSKPIEGVEFAPVKAVLVRTKKPQPTLKNGKPYGDKYCEGWYASMADSCTLACDLTDNPYELGTPEYERWALGCLHGMQEDKDNRVEREES